MLLRLGTIVAQIWHDYCSDLARLLLRLGKIVAMTWHDCCLDLARLLLRFALAVKVLTKICMSILQLLAGEDQGLLVRGNIILVLDLQHVLDGIVQVIVLPGKVLTKISRSHRAGGAPGEDWTPSGCCSPPGCGHPPPAC